MLGKTTLFVSGFDHAGISTQSVVEKPLFKLLDRIHHDLGHGREKVPRDCWSGKNESVVNNMSLISSQTGTKNNNFIDLTAATTGLVLPSHCNPVGSRVGFVSIAPIF